MIFLLLIVTTAAQLQQFFVTPTNLVVDQKTDLSWTLITGTSYNKQDCFIISFHDYDVFHTLGQTPCMSNFIICQIDSPQQLRLTVIKTIKGGTIQGQTASKPFQNPLQAQQFKQVMVQFYSQCNLNNKPQINDKISSPIQFSPMSIDAVQLQFISSSQVYGASNQNLTFNFNPRQNFPSSGQIFVKTPQWYTTAVKIQGLNQDQMSYENVLDENSMAIVNQGDLVITNITFDQASGITKLAYYSNATWNFNLSITLTNFRNPVNKYPLGGFQLSFVDQNGAMCAQSPMLNLKTVITQTQKLQFQTMTFLGDQKGEDVAKINTLNQVEFQILSPVPLEPKCIVEFKFPQQLTVTQIQKISGTGIFKPLKGEQLTSDFFSLSNNILTVRACNIPNQLPAKPQGTLLISYVRLPPFITTTDPVYIKITSSNTLVIDNPQGPLKLAQDMVPGRVELIEFKPSTQKTFAKNVSYTIGVQFENAFFKNQRIVVDLPPLLEFDYPCVLGLIPGNCSIVNGTATIYTPLELPPNSKIQFILYNGTNPSRLVQVGPWNISHQIQEDGVWYKQDVGEFKKSFVTKAGWIKTQMTYNNTLTWSSDTEFSFTCITEYGIPPGGSFMIQVCPQCGVSDKIQATGFVNATNDTIVISVNEGLKKEQPHSFKIQGIRNPRSLEPSDPFIISSTDQRGYIIDQGTDQRITMTQITKFDSLEIKPFKLENGLVGRLHVEFNSNTWIQNKDRLYFTLPYEMQAVVQQLDCKPDKNNKVGEVSCQSAGKIVIVELTKVTQQQGLFGVYVYGIRNPPSFKVSSPFQDVVLKSESGYLIQQSTKQITVQTKEPGQITNFQVVQSSEQYGENSNLRLTFEPINALQPQGTLSISWPNTSPLYTNSTCQISANRLFTDKCRVDPFTQTMTIQNVFNIQYSGQIQIYISRIRNPNTNKNLQPFVVKTFDGQFQSDQLSFYPSLECNYPCKKCGTNKDYCTVCWPQDPNFFIMRKGNSSSCKRYCDDGFTSNGNRTSIGDFCSQCDASCLTCEDNRDQNDYKRCRKCHPKYRFFDPLTKACMAQCPLGMYDQGNNTCGICSSNCQSCSMSPDNCTSCVQNSNLSALFQSKCYQNCPDGFTNKAGECQPCKSPCKTCAWSENVCLSCDNTLQRIFMHGFTCLDRCPLGTLTVDKSCIGCKAGCRNCNQTDQSTCLECDGLLLHQGDCVTQCPKGYRMNSTSSKCDLAPSQDLKLVYFPVIIATGLVGLTSWIGRRVKPRHLILSNFIVMMGVVEHIALISQLALAFYQADQVLGFMTLACWLCYFICQLAFNLVFQKLVQQDKLLQQWVSEKQNNKARKLINASGWISWKCYKLLYSHFFGYQIKTSNLSNPKIFQNLMLGLTVVNVVTTYLPITALNIYYISQTHWGQQIFIMLVDNLVMAVVMTVLSLLEQLKMPLTMKKDFDRKNNFSDIMGPIKVFSRCEQDEKKENQQLLRRAQGQGVFVSVEFEKLFLQFGGRKCKSLCLQREKDVDPRYVRSYPISPNLPPVMVDDPPIPLGPPQPDNCLYEASDNLQPIFDGRNKATQAGSMILSDVKRFDSKLVSLRQNQETAQGKRQTKLRGRKCTLMQYIDGEDYKVMLKERKDYLDYAEQQIMQNYYLPQDLVSEVEDNVHDQLIQAALETMRIEDEEFFKEFQIRFDQSEQEILRQSGLDQFPVQRLNSALVNNVPFESQCDWAEQLVSENVQIGNRIETQRSSQGAFENFSPWEIIGDFDYSRWGDPSSFCINSSGQLFDLKDRPINVQGFLMGQRGDIISWEGKIIIPQQNLDNGLLPSLFNLDGNRFSILEVMGVLEVSNGRCIINNNMDKNGQLVNRMGYLITNEGHVCNNQGQIIFRKYQLKNGDFPKIFNPESLQIRDSGRFKRDKKKVRDSLEQLINQSDFVVDSSNSRQLQKHALEQIFNQSELGDQIIVASSRTKRKTKSRMVKVQKFLETDIQMANVYGGQPKAREMMVPRRFASVARQVPNPRIQNLTKPETTQITSTAGSNGRNRTDSQILTQLDILTRKLNQ